MPRSNRPSPARKDRRAPRALRAVAVFKIGKALLLVALEIGAFRLLDPRVMESAEHWVAALGAGALDRHAVQLVLDKLTGLSDARLQALGIGGFVLAALFAIEGVGLWLGRRWAEFLTVIATACLIPVEVYELTQKASWPRVSTLVLNLTLVAYLGWQLWRELPARRLHPAVD